MSKHYTPLLPALPDGNLQDGNHSPDDNEQRPPWENRHILRARRPQVPVACQACRSKKRKCDGQRPKCSRCETKELECLYEAEEGDLSRYSALKRKFTQLEDEHGQMVELYNFIRLRPEPEAQEIFNRIRLSEDPLLVLRFVKEADLLLLSNKTGPSGSTELIGIKAKAVETNISTIGSD